LRPAVFGVKRRFSRLCSGGAGGDYPGVWLPGEDNVKNFTNFSCGRGALLLKRALNFAVEKVKVLSSPVLIFLQQ
jgi:hypothetical protein